MEILRTDSGGSFNDDSRLKLLREMLEFHKLPVLKIHDHKGELSVYWMDDPTSEDLNKVNYAWEFLNECSVKHFSPEWVQL